MPRKRKSRSSTQTVQALARQQDREAAARLKTQQRAEAAALRQRQKDDTARRRALDKSARARLKQIHKLQRQRATAQRKLVRHNAAILKRKGLIPREFDVRKLKPSGTTRRLFKKFAKVLAGHETSYKVKPEAAKKLRQQGYTVTKDNRVILSKTLGASPSGKISTRIGKGPQSGRRVTLTTDFHNEIHAAFQALKPEQFIGISVYGNLGYDLYQVEDEMLKAISRYLERKAKIDHIAIFGITDLDEYEALRDEESVEVNNRRNERRRTARRAKKARK